MGQKLAPVAQAIPRCAGLAILSLAFLALCACAAQPALRQSRELIYQSVTVYRDSLVECHNAWTEQICGFGMRMNGVDWAWLKFRGETPGPVHSILITLQDYAEQGPYWVACHDGTRWVTQGPFTGSRRNAIASLPADAAPYTTWWAVLCDAAAPEHGIVIKQLELTYSLEQ
jgi:hypothetical protein